MDPIIYIIIGFFVLLGVMWLITQPLFWFGAATVVLIVVSLLIRNRRASQLRARVQFMDSEVLATLDGYAFETYFSKQLGNLGIRNRLTKRRVILVLIYLCLRPKTMECSLNTIQLHRLELKLYRKYTRARTIMGIHQWFLQRVAFQSRQ